MGVGLDRLVTDLAAADPAVRDEKAYPELVSLIRSGELDDRLVPLGDAMVGRLGHPEIQARTFAPLILAAIVDRGITGPGWYEAFAAWWLAETDLRGWDDRLGWLHAIAHGADLAGAFGSPDALDLVARRVTAPTGYHFAQMEEDRVARAVVRILTRPDVDPTGWLSVVDDLFATGGPGPLPVPVANTLAVLRATYVMADRRDLPHRAAVTDGIARRLHEAFPAYPAQCESSTR
nr:DUF2785 domain-containing protein [uncultured Actinoplanes sp.]